jgi:hypothetical protein
MAPEIRSHFVGADSTHTFLYQNVFQRFNGQFTLNSNIRTEADITYGS